MIDEFNLNIENLILENFSPALREQLGEAIQQALRDLFKQHHVSIEHLQTQQIEQLEKVISKLDANASVQTIAQEIALAIFNQLIS